jgi:hypothetical protein
MVGQIVSNCVTAHTCLSDWVRVRRIDPERWDGLASRRGTRVNPWMTPPPELPSLDSPGNNALVGTPVARTDAWLAKLPSGIPGPVPAWFDRLTMRGALAGMLEAAREAIAAQTSPIRARRLSGTALDATGARAGKRNWWLCVFRRRTAPSSPSSRRAANAWSRGPAAVSAPISGPNLWPVPLISSATPNMPSAPATASSRPAYVAGENVARTRDPEGLCRASRGSSAIAWLARRRTRPASSSSASSRRSGGICSSSPPTGPYRRPTTAPDVRYAPAPCSGKLLTVFAPAGARSSLAVSSPASKPPTGAREAIRLTIASMPLATASEPHAATGGSSIYTNSGLGGRIILFLKQNHVERLERWRCQPEYKLPQARQCDAIRMIEGLAVICIRKVVEHILRKQPAQC